MNRPKAYSILNNIYMDYRKTNKRLVRHLMDVKNVECITITESTVLIQVNSKFTPDDGVRLVKEVGHADFRPVTRDGKNYLVLSRW